MGEEWRSAGVAEGRSWRMGSEKLQFFSCGMAGFMALFLFVGRMQWTSVFLAIISEAEYSWEFSLWMLQPGGRKGVDRKVRVSVGKVTKN